METILNFFSENFWATCTLIGTLTITCTGFITSKFVIKGFWKQLISWFISIALTIGTYYIGIVEMKDPIWLSMILTGLVVGLASNGIYEIPVMKNFIKKLFNIVKDKE